jgi:hypothetical protein
MSWLGILDCFLHLKFGHSAYSLAKGFAVKIRLLSRTAPATVICILSKLSFRLYTWLQSLSTCFLIFFEHWWAPAQTLIIYCHPCIWLSCMPSWNLNGSNTPSRHRFQPNIGRVLSMSLRPLLNFLRQTVIGNIGSVLPSEIFSSPIK